MQISIDRGLSTAAVWLAVAVTMAKYDVWAGMAFSFIALLATLSIWGWAKKGRS